MTHAQRPILVFGSLHYDILVDAPDRPRRGETVTGHAWRPKCGGKGGNQAVAAARAGASVAMAGAVGDDDFGRALLGNLDRHGIDRTLVRIRTGSGSGMSVAIFDADRDYGAVIVSGASGTLGQSDAYGLALMAGSAPILVLQNEIPEDANLAAAECDRAAGGTVILNAAPARPLSARMAEAVDILAVNGIEAGFLAATAEVASLSQAAEAARALLGRFRAALVTAGKAGAAYADRSGVAVSIPGVPVEVESTHGAGDEFVGAFAAALARGDPVEDALQAANRAAALLVSTPEALRAAPSLANRASPL